MFSHCVLLLPLQLFSADFVNSHQEWQRGKGAFSSPVADGHSQQSNLSGEHQGDVQGDDEEEAGGSGGRQLQPKFRSYQWQVQKEINGENGQ